jgi:hypothetical protein
LNEARKDPRPAGDGRRLCCDPYIAGRHRVHRRNPRHAGKRLDGSAESGIEDTCTESTIHGTVTLNTTEAEGQLTEGGPPPTGWTFGSCTKDTNVIKAGSLTINSAGEVFTKESRVEVKDTFLGVTCFYGAEIGSVMIGTFDGGTPAKLTVNTTTLQKETGSGAFCASAGTWTANYVVTTPSVLLFT